MKATLKKQARPSVPSRNRRTATARTPSFEWSNDWHIGFRIWIERAGHAVLGRGRADLLAAIDRSRSISAAAREMDMSYRHAWTMVQEINQNADAPLVESSVGGTRGGGAQLTEYGRQALAVFDALQAAVTEKLSRSLRQVKGTRRKGVMH